MSTPVHPRACGEQDLTAGALRGPPVHPRACGEQVTSLANCVGSSGSSPRLRGTAAKLRRRPAPGRFIPAPAGNRWLRCTRHPNRPVHPRACGEQCLRRQYRTRWDGSSPRLRGTEPCGTQQKLRCRFIPAPAGNSSSAVPWAFFSSVHPRACGEQIDQRCRAMVSGGSSPRLRGTVHHVTRFLPSSRFIPAPAGNRLVFMSLMVCDLYGALISTNIPPAGDSR